MKRVLSLLFMLSLSFFTNAQNAEYIKETVQKIIPPSPSAYEFSRFGNIPLNGSTGGFSYGLPIYTIQSDDITLPISIGYYSNGVHVDNLSGTVGTNWTLNAGGVISRVIKDYPDELAGSGGRWYPDVINTSDPNNLDGLMIYNLARESSYDGEQDWFSFNVNGISGSFYFDQNLVPHVLSDENISISYKLNSNSIFLEFTITDDKGFKYVFGGSEEFIEINQSIEDCSGPPQSYYTSWFLKEIISPKNNSITMNYAENNLFYKTSLVNNLTFSSQCPNPYLPIFLSRKDCLNRNSMQSKVISSINFKNGMVIFDYNSLRQDGGGKSLKDIKIMRNNVLINQVNLDYEMVTNRPVPMYSELSEDTSLKYRLFLKEILFKGNLQSSNLQKYQFEYYEKDKLPNRLSFSKDKYGFNNGSTNANPFSSTLSETEVWSYINQGSGSLVTANLEVNPTFVYYGMLKKITYPTGGYTQILYEANKDAKISETKVPLNQTIGIVKYCGTGTTPVTGSFEFVSNGLPLNFEAYADYQGSNCTANPNTIDRYNIKIYKDNQMILDVYNSFGVHCNSDKEKQCLSNFTSTYANEPICTVAGSAYKVVMALLKEGVYGNVKVKYNGDYIEETIYGGGARVQEITDFTNNDGYNKRKIYYNKLAEYNSNNTTMLHAYDAKFYTPQTGYIIPCISNDSPYLEYAAQKFSIQSSSYTSNYLSRQPITYSAITEIHEKNSINNGAIERVFHADANTPGQMILGNDLYSVPASNYGDFFKDKIVQETIYDNQNNPKSKKDFEYSLLSNEYLTNIIARRNYKIPGEADWDDTSGASAPIVFPPFSNFSIWTYKNYYGIVKLVNTKETNYFSNQNVVTTSTNTYGNQPFFLLNSNSVTNSKGETIKAEYKYPSDLVGVEQTPYMQQLVDAHRIGEPIITKTFKDNIKLSENHIKFENSSYTSNLLLPKEIYTKKGILDVNIAVLEDRKLVFNQYDDLGNVQQYTPENGIPVSVVWGYNKNEPIAKIQNASFSDFQSQVANLQTLSDTGTEIDLINALSTLRTSLPNAFVTSYTYKPLVGVSTITDPKGNTTYYEYDEFNRLKQVKDKDGKILSANEYHYKN